MPSSTLISSDMGLISLTAAPHRSTECNATVIREGLQADLLHMPSIQSPSVSCTTARRALLATSSVKFHNFTMLPQEFADGLPNCENCNSFVPQIFKGIQYATGYLLHEGLSMHIDCVGLGHEAWTVNNHHLQLAS